MFGRKQIAVLVAEFLGTGVLAIIMLAVQHSAIPLPYFIAIAAGLTLAMLVSVLNGSGANYFNPAITIGMWTIRQIGTVRALSYLVVQLLAAWVAYHLYVFFVKTDLQPIGGNYDVRVLVAEAVGGMLLAMAYAAAVFNGYTNSKKAVTVGGAFGIAIVVAGAVPMVSLGIVNPAVAISERAFDLFGSMGWTTYALGPIAGAVIGANLYALLFAEESSFVRVQAAMSERLNRSKTANASANAVSAINEEETIVVAEEAPVASSKRAPRGTKTKTTKSSSRKKTTRTRK